MVKKIFFSLALILIISGFVFAQTTRHDKAVFIDTKNEFWDSLTTALNKFYKKDASPKKKLLVDFILQRQSTSLPDTGTTSRFRRRTRACAGVFRPHHILNPKSIV
jgi:hypothetical protein